jgi:hypothetical protein
MFVEPADKAMAPAAAALDRPAAQRAMTRCLDAELLEPRRCRGDRERCFVGARSGDHDGSGVGLFVCVDTDDDIDTLCENGHCIGSLSWGRCARVRSSEGARQHCDGTHSAATGWSSSLSSHQLPRRPGPAPTARHVHYKARSQLTFPRFSGGVGCGDYAAVAALVCRAS